MVRTARAYPDKREFRAVWLGLDAETRRRVSAAVLRGQALDDPVDAGLAAGLARHHPARGRFMIALITLGAAFVIGALAGLLTGGGGGSIPLAVILLAITVLNAVRYVRLGRAERLNAEVLARHMTRQGKRPPITPSST